MGVRLLFGAIGLTVALLTALGANALFDAANTPTLLAGSRVLLFETRDEITERLEQVGAQFGDPQFSLAWNNRNDLDLHVIDPAGNHIWYRQRRSPTGGELDVDANADPLRATDRPVENIYWAPGDAPEGTYQVYVHHYANHGAPDPTRYTLRITANGRTRVFEGSLRYGENSNRIAVNPREVSDWYPLPAERRYWALAVMSGWGALLGCALALGLRLPQAFFRQVERAAFRASRVVGNALGGAILGALAGFLGQLLFGWLGFLGDSFARFVGLITLGGLLGYGLAHCTPNLPVNPARGAGAVGGALSLWLYHWALQNHSDATGRWLVAALLGLAIGLMITLLFWKMHYALVRSGGTLMANRFGKAYRVVVNRSRS
ncbi:MAG: YfaP family protein [Fimbriimonadales bacterium]